MFKYASVLMVITLLLLTKIGNCQDCTDSNYIIPSSILDDVFNNPLDTLRSDQNLVALIQQPNEENLRTYALSLAPVAAPLFALAVLAIIFFVICSIQLCCFDCCGNQ